MGSPIKITQALADRAGRYDELIAAGPVVNLRFRRGQKALSLRAGKLFHLLVKQAGARLADDVAHTMRLSDLWDVGHLRSADIVETIRELASTLVEIIVANPSKASGAPSHRHIIGAMLSHVERDEDDAGELVFRFSETMRRVMKDSDHWAVISRRAVLAFESRYSLRLYELVSLRKGLSHKVDETFDLDDLRQRLGVPDSRLTRWVHFKQKALDPAIAELNHLSGFTVSYEPIKQGRSVAAIRLTWAEKTAPERKAAAKELDRTRAGRKARRAGTVEIIADTAEASGGAPLPVPAPFPASGSISFGNWGAIVREHAPKPTPDVDRVADAFRSWARLRKLDLASKTIEKAFTGFCRQFSL